MHLFFEFDSRILSLLHVAAQQNANTPNQHMC